MKPFKTFLAESFNDNHHRLLQELLESLRVLLLRRFAEIKKDNDASILLSIAQTFMLKSILFVSEVELSDDIKHVTKAFIVLGDRYLDSTGIYDKTKLMQKNKLNKANFNEKTFIGNIPTLIKYAATPKQKSPLSSKEKTELYALINSFYDKLDTNLA